MREVDLFEAVLGGAALSFVVVWWMIGMPIYYRPRARKLGEPYTRRQALKDASPGLLLLSLSFSKLASSHYFSEDTNGHLMTASLVSLVALVLSFCLLPFRTTDEKFERWKILKEMEESPNGISSTLVRNAQVAGRLRWLASGTMLLFAVSIPLMFPRSQIVPALSFFLVPAAMGILAFRHFGKIARQDPAQLPPRLR